MAYMDINKLLAYASYGADRVVKNPRVVVVGKHKVMVTGVWRRHAPYLMRYTLESNVLGGAEMKASILPFYGLYVCAGDESVTTQLRYDDKKRDGFVDTLLASEYLVKLVTLDAEVTHSAPKGLTRADLIEWTVAKAGVGHETVVEHFNNWKI